MTAKTLLFGLDGFDAGYLDGLIGEGVAPNFRKLRDGSRRTTVNVHPGMGAGPFWISAATGLHPAAHGRYYFLQFNPKNYDVAPFRDVDRYRRQAFWKILDEAGKKTAVIDWHWAPLVDLENGVMINEWLAHDSLSGLETSPQSFARRLLTEYGDDPLAGGYPAHDFRAVSDHARFAKAALERIRVKARFCCDQLRNKNWDIFTPCFGELHHIGHFYMHAADRTHSFYSDELHDAVGDPLRECYIALDKTIGDIRAAAGADAITMLLGGPGMEPLISANTAMDQIAMRLDLGVETPASAGQSIRGAYRALFPSRLKMRLSPLARRVRQWIADDDYKRRRFFAVPHNDNSGAVRVNLKGREKYGTIAPGPEFDAVLKEMREGFLSLKNAETGAPAVSEVVITRDCLDGRYIDELPDAFIIWNRIDNDKNFTVITSERTGDIDMPAPLRTGDHKDTGCFWSTNEHAAVFSQQTPHYADNTTQSIIDAVTSGDIATLSRNS